MSSNTNPEASYDLQTEKMNYLGIVFSGLTYGIHVALYIACLRPIFNRGRWLGVYISMLFTLATVGIALQIYWHGVAFVDHRNDPGGPYDFLKQNVRHPVNLALTAIYLLLNWLADGILLYRFYVIYSVIGKHSVLTTIVSSVTLLALIVTGSVFLPHIAALGSNLWTDISTTPGIAYLTLSLSTNVILTFLIVGRIIYIGRQLRQFGSQYCKQYTSIITLLIESAALYTFWALISVIACSANNPVQFAVLPALGQLQAIPPLLIMTQIASGRALKKDTYSSINTITSKVRFSTNCVDTLPPYTYPEKGRSQCFASPLHKLPLDEFDDRLSHSYTPTIKYSNASRTSKFTSNMDNLSDSSSTLEFPGQIYVAI